MTEPILPALTLQRCDASEPDFRALVQQLDVYLALRNGVEQDFYGQFNGLESIRHVVLARRNSEAIGCGAFKELEPGVVEIKRMFVPPSARRQGVAAQVLAELERWAQELHYNAAVLETGVRHDDAIALYQKQGYQIIANYGQYQGMAGSVCFRKELHPASK